MTQIKSIPHVGAQDPEMKNSPVADDTDDEIYVLRQEFEDLPYCYYNNSRYGHGSYVNSGTEVLVCSNGIWVYHSNSDPDKP